MSKYIPDISSHRWVIISPQRISRPENHDSKKRCPFCIGHEGDTPPELMRIGEGEPNTPGWKVRVIPNKYPITDFHEVIIHAPKCGSDIEGLHLNQVELIFKAYKTRYNFYRKSGQVLIFCNHGREAGSSLDHPHSQLVVIPSQINLDALAREPLNNAIEDGKYFSVYCPEFSQWPYEIWVAPKKKDTVFGDITDEEITSLAEILQNMLKKLKNVFKKHQSTSQSFDYNYYIYPKENWYVRIIPRFIYRAGFELGTGLSVNVMDPIMASLEFKGVDERTRNVLDKLKKKI